MLAARVWMVVRTLFFVRAILVLKVRTDFVTPSIPGKEAVFVSPSALMAPLVTAVMLLVEKLSRAER